MELFFPNRMLMCQRKKWASMQVDSMMIPSRIFPDIIVIHAQFRFCFLKALLNGPSHTAEPHESWQPGAQECIADLV